MPTFSGRWTVRTSAGRPTGTQPLPTSTTSRSTPSCARSDSSARSSSAGRVPMTEHHRADARQVTGHRSRRDVRIATRWPTIVSAGEGQQHRHQAARHGQVAGDGVADRSDQRERGSSPPSGRSGGRARSAPSSAGAPPPRPGARPRRRGPAAASSPFAARARWTPSLSDLFTSTRTASSAPSVVQPPIESSPPSARTPRASGMALSATVWPSLSRKKPTGEKVCRHLATSPSQQSHSICSWPRRTASTAPSRPGQQQRRARRGARDDHQHRHAVGGDGRRQQHAREVGREPALVEVGGPVLGVAPAPDGLRLGDRPQLGDRRAGRRPVAQPPSTSGAGGAERRTSRSTRTGSTTRYRMPSSRGEHPHAPLEQPPPPTAASATTTRTRPTAPSPSQHDRCRRRGEAVQDAVEVVVVVRRDDQQEGVRRSRGASWLDERPRP